MSIYIKMSLIISLILLAFSIQTSFQCTRQRSQAEEAEERRQQCQYTQNAWRARLQKIKSTAAFQLYTESDLSTNLKLFENPEEFTTIQNQINEMEINYGNGLNTLINGLYVASSAPYIGSAAGLLASGLQFINGLQETSTSPSEMWSLVSTVADRQVFIQKLSDIRSHLETIEPILTTLQTTRYSDVQKGSEVIVGVNTLRLILNFFKEKSSVLTKYPLNSGPILLAMTGIYQTFIPIAITISPTFNEYEGIAVLNTLKNLLNEYKELSIKFRKESLKIVKWSKAALDNYSDYRSCNIETCPRNIEKSTIRKEFDCVITINDTLRADNCFKSRDKCSLVEESKWSSERTCCPKCNLAYSSCNSYLECIQDPISKVTLLSDNYEHRCYKDYIGSMAIKYNGNEGYGKFIDSVGNLITAIENRVK